MKKFPITPEGYQKLTIELKKLLTEERPNIIKAISDARALGDLSENAEYHAAKDKQGFIASLISGTIFFPVTFDLLSVISFAVLLSEPSLCAT